MLFCALVLLLVWLILAVSFWAGTLFIQGYIYENPVSDLYWRAPAAGAVLTLFIGCWCFLNYGAEPPPAALPYDALFNFSGEKIEPPVREFWALKPEGKVHYRIRKLGTMPPRYEYYTDQNELWQTARSRQVQAILIQENGREVHFSANPALGIYTEEGGRRYIDDELLGQIVVPRPGSLVISIVLNLIHLGVWFACLWLLLGFQWPHALGLAAASWLIMTLALPYILAQVPRRTVVPAARTSAMYQKMMWIR